MTLAKKIIDARDKLVQEKIGKYGVTDCDSLQIVAPVGLREATVEKLIELKKIYGQHYLYTHTLRHLHGFVFEEFEYNLKNPPLTPWVLYDERFLEADLYSFFSYLAKRSIIIRYIRMGTSINCANGKRVKTRAVEAVVRQLANDLDSE